MLSFIPILHLSLRLLIFYNPSLRSFVSTEPLIAPLIDPYCFGRFLLLVSTVLPFAVFHKYLWAQIAPHTDLYCRKFFLFSVLWTVLLYQTTDLRDYPLPLNFFQPLLLILQIVKKMNRPTALLYKGAEQFSSTRFLL